MKEMTKKLTTLIKGLWIRLEKARLIALNSSLCLIAGSYAYEIALAGGKATTTTTANTSSNSTIVSQICTDITNVYNDVRTIATVLAALSIAICLIVGWFATGQKATEQSRAVAKGIFGTWVILMTLGLIFSYASNLGTIKNAPNKLPTTTAPAEAGASTATGGN